MKKTVFNLVVKFGSAIACCAFAFVVLSANTSCTMPFYEPKAPKELTNVA